MFDLLVKVKDNKKISPDLWVLSFDSEKLAQTIVPGQFLEFKVRNSTDPFLRRPFSVYKIKNNTIEILYEVVGEGTHLMSELQPGDTFLSLGPLGTTFTPQKNKKVIMVGGGVGAAPLVFLAQKQDFDSMMLGFRGESAVLPLSEAIGDDNKWVYATNDGSVGHKGFITQPLEELFKQEDSPENLFIYSCGPNPMLLEVARICQQYGVDGEVSLEERMGCGVGACLGCAVLTKSKGYVPSCKYGPVFNIQDLELDELKNSG